MSQTLYKYRIWCSVDNEWKFVWAEEAPTTCSDGHTAHAIDEDQTVVVDKVTEQHVQIDGPRDMSSYPFWRRSILCEPVAEQDTLFHYKPGKTVGLCGGGYQIVGAVTPGDYVELSITDQDNILGYGAGFEVKKYVFTEYIADDDSWEFYTDSADEMPNGLYLTCKYHSAGTTVPKVMARYNFRDIPAS